MNASSTNIAGLGLFLNRTTGTDYNVNIDRYHYRAGNGLSIRRGYYITPTPSTVPNTELSINYAGEELAGYPETFLTTYRWLAATGWFQYTTGINRNTTTNRVSVNGITGFSYWTLAPDNVLLSQNTIQLQATLQPNKQNVLLTWKSTEKHCTAKQFFLERSFDGKTFETLATFDNLSTSQYLDLLTQPKAYYRLKWLDFENNLWYSDIATVNKPLEELVKIYPNPFSEKLNIQLIDKQIFTNLFLHDESGKLLAEVSAPCQEAEVKLNAQLANLPKGNYILIVCTNDYQVSQKLVKY
ncbi:MAG: T9SS type A sorting domain-containing protein [Microscillaceae bacterium]|nr:T9SS type A sorting domain-containing protein [Microscillaceae bacterium]MDW8459610.1 T9SS type A sorting domain-containing protein [Cytophagales bacterium]